MITAMPRIAIAVRSFEGIVSTFQDTLGMPVIDSSEEALSKLGIKVGMCVPTGGSNIELMSPGNTNTPLGKSLTNFIERRGEGLFALMLEAPNPDAEAKRLSDAGLKVLPMMEGSWGRDIHPSSTHGVLIRIYPCNSFTQKLDEPEASLGLSGVVRVVIAVTDIDAAAQIYGSKIGMKANQECIDAQRGVRSIHLKPGRGGEIELVSAFDSNKEYCKRIESFLRLNGEGMFELALQTADVDSAETALLDRKVRVSKSGNTIDLDGRDISGVRIHIAKT